MRAATVIPAMRSPRSHRRSYDRSQPRIGTSLGPNRPKPVPSARSLRSSLTAVPNHIGETGPGPCSYTEVKGDVRLNGEGAFQVFPRRLMRIRQASPESFRLQLVELGLGDRSRIEELFGRGDLLGARAATARGDD